MNADTITAASAVVIAFSRRARQSRTLELGAPPVRTRLGVVHVHGSGVWALCDVLPGSFLGGRVAVT